MINPASLIQSIVTLQKACLHSWKKDHVALAPIQTASFGVPHGDELLQLVAENHAFNYQLWHAEDRARRDDQGFEFVYRAKREIDHCNQQRNNRMEQIDQWLYHALQPAPSESCPHHSETPGMMVDRLSILTLKAFYMQKQVTRIEVDLEHQRLCSMKLERLHQQHQNLARCLEQLIHETLEKKKTFQVYFQFKMYNDPTLNPELYANQS